MVNIEDRLEQIKALVDDGKYFVINRARQYGKTTTLHMLTLKLSDQYLIFSISFEGMGDSAYRDEWAFCRKVSRLLYDVMYYGETGEVAEKTQEECRRMSLEDARPDLRILSNFFPGSVKSLRSP